jgi:prephenate dehydrogenase
MKSLPDTRIAIVGLGLMGGSLAGALRGQCREVVGVARRQETVEAALARGLADRGTTDLAAGVRQADVIVLATPVRTIVRQLEEIGPLAPPGCLVMDLGSTKRDVVAAMERLPAHIQPLGGHPMCGKELAGVEAADPALYRERTFILTPLARTSQEALALGIALAEAVGARPLVLDAERQDCLVATLSHLPYLIACALVATADATVSADPAAWQIVASGFRDTSRVAGSDVTMMADILLTNREHVLKALEAYDTQFHNLMRLVETGNESEMREVLERVRAIRKEMFP